MRSAALVIVGAACGTAPAPTTTAPPTPTRPTSGAHRASPVVDAPPARAVDPYAHLNLGFEEVDGGRPAGWTASRADLDAVVVDAGAHGGARALRITAPPATIAAASPGLVYGAVGHTIDAAPLVGKWVRVHAWVKPTGVTGRASAWLRVDGGERTYSYGGPDDGYGTADWTQVTAVSLVTAGTTVSFGVMLDGRTGEALFDDVRIEVVDARPAPTPITLAGRVVDASGAAVADAEVSLVGGSGAIAQRARTGAAGGFSFATTTGRWAVSAHAAGGTGAFVPGADYAADVMTLAVTLGPAADGVTVRGTAAGAASEGAYAQVAVYSKLDGDVFAIPIGADGAFTAILPRGDRYAASILAGGEGRATFVRAGDTATGAIAVAGNAPAPAAVVDWLRARAIPLASSEPGGDRADLAPLRALVGKARVVALGEATHGTHEFGRVKHRLIEHLVAELGFTVLAFELGQVEARTIDAYVTDGVGSARTALSAARNWVWETEEVLALLEWIRAWNADPAHAARKVRFAGFDMQSADAGYRAVAAYLARVAPGDAAALLAPIERLGHEVGAVAVASRPEAEQRAIIAGVDVLAARFAAERKAWTKATSAAEYARARQDVENLRQAVAQYTARIAGASGPALRDAAMAENAAWIVANAGKGAKVIVWAHDLHVASPATGDEMGRHLRAKLGKSMVNVGFVLGQGAFAALGPEHNLDTFTVPPVPDGYVAAAFARAGVPRALVDLRALPKTGAVADWFRAPQVMQETGYRFGPDDDLASIEVLAGRYDALLYLEETTPIRQLPTDPASGP
jgi:erythromycin esterase